MRRVSLYVCDSPGSSSSWVYVYPIMYCGGVAPETPLMWKFSVTVGSVPLMQIGSSRVTTSSSLTENVRVLTAGSAQAAIVMSAVMRFVIVYWPGAARLGVKVRASALNAGVDGVHVNVP